MVSKRTRDDVLKEYRRTVGMANLHNVNGMADRILELEKRLAKAEAQSAAAYSELRNNYDLI